MSGGHKRKPTLDSIKDTENEGQNKKLKSVERVPDINASILDDLDPADFEEIAKHLPDISISEILQSQPLFCLALIYAARGAHRTFMKRMALAGVSMRDTYDHSQLEICSSISNALQKNDFDALRKLLEESLSDPVMKDQSAHNLITSVLLCGCSFDFLEFIIGSFVILNKKRGLSYQNVLDGFDSNGLTPLMSAVLSGNLPCVQGLLEKGTDMDILQAPCTTDKSSGVENKTCAKINLEGKSFKKGPLYSSSKTALMYAVCTGNFECVEILLKFKPDMSKKCSAGFTALSYAAISNYDCLNLLLTTPVPMNKNNQLKTQKQMESVVKNDCGITAESAVVRFGDSVVMEAIEDSDDAVEDNDETKLEMSEGELRAKYSRLTRKCDEEIESEDSNSLLEKESDISPYDSQSLDHCANLSPSSSVSKVSLQAPMAFVFSTPIVVEIETEIQSDTALDVSKWSTQTPMTFTLSTPSIVQMDPNIDLTSKEKQRWTDFSLKFEPKFTIGTGTTKSSVSSSKSKSKIKHDTKREGTTQKQQHNIYSAKNVDDVRVRVSAEASLPFAIEIGDDINCLRLLLSHCGFVGRTDKSGKTPLILAAQRGKADYVELLLKNWAGVDFPVSLVEEETALMVAAQHGHKDCVKILLENKADPNAENWNKETPLMHAAKNGRVECLKLLLEYKADVHALNTKGQTSLIIATENENTECIELLLKSGSQASQVDWCSKSSLMYAAKSGNAPNADLLLKALTKEDSNKISAGPSENKQADLNSSIVNSLAEKSLPYCVRGGNIRCFEILLPYCRNFNQPEFMATNTALMIAAETGLVDWVKRLIEHGVDLNYTEGKGMRSDEKGKTALICATLARNKECLQLLLEHGADPNKGCVLYSTMQNAITIAISNKDVDCVKLLVKYGANVMAGDSNSAFMLALESDEGVKSMVEAGVRVDISEFYEWVKSYKLFSSPKYLESLLKGGVLTMRKEICDKPSDTIHLPNFMYHTFGKPVIPCFQLLMQYQVFDWKAWGDSNFLREMLFMAACAEIPIKEFFHDDQLVTPLQFAIMDKQEDILRYLLSNFHFTLDDYRVFTSNSINGTPVATDWLDSELVTTCFRNPWRLETLCLLTTSDSLTNNNNNNAASSLHLPRTKQVDSLPIPDMFKTILKHNRPHSRLCIKDWKYIGNPPNGAPAPNSILCLTKTPYPPVDVLEECAKCSCDFPGKCLNLRK